MRWASERVCLLSSTGSTLRSKRERASVRPSLPHGSGWAGPGRAGWWTTGGRGGLWTHGPGHRPRRLTSRSADSVPMMWHFLNPTRVGFVGSFFLPLCAGKCWRLAGSCPAIPRQTPRSPALLLYPALSSVAFPARDG